MKKKLFIVAPRKSTVTKSGATTKTPEKLVCRRTYQLGDEGLCSGGTKLNSIFITAEIQKRSSGKQNLSVNREGKRKSINGKRSEQGEQVRLGTIVGMIRGSTSKKRPHKQSEQWLDNEISFPSTLGVQNAIGGIFWRIVKSHSSYNVILGRTGIRSLGAVASTIHSMIKFPSANGIATVTTKKETLHECWRIEEAQGKALEGRITFSRIPIPDS
ncbi:hypothetical protein Tco_0079306 [Tanacetum coccineum]